MLNKERENSETLLWQRTASHHHYIDLWSPSIHPTWCSTGLPRTKFYWDIIMLSKTALLSNPGDNLSCFFHMDIYIYVWLNLCFSIFGEYMCIIISLLYGEFLLIPNIPCFPWTSIGHTIKPLASFCSCCDFSLWVNKGMYGHSTCIPFAVKLH